MVRVTPESALEFGCSVKQHRASTFSKRSPRTTIAPRILSTFRRTSITFPRFVTASRFAVTRRSANALLAPTRMRQSHPPIHGSQVTAQTPLGSESRRTTHQVWRCASIRLMARPTDLSIPRVYLWWNFRRTPCENSSPRRPVCSSRFWDFCLSDSWSGNSPGAPSDQASNRQTPGRLRRRSWRSRRPWRRPRRLLRLPTSTSAASCGRSSSAS